MLQATLTLLPTLCMMITAVSSALVAGSSLRISRVICRRESFKAHPLYDKEIDGDG